MEAPGCLDDESVASGCMEASGCLDDESVASGCMEASGCLDDESVEKIPYRSKIGHNHNLTYSTQRTDLSW